MLLAFSNQVKYLIIMFFFSLSILFILCLGRPYATGGGGRRVSITSATTMHRHMSSIGSTQSRPPSRTFRGQQPQQQRRSSSVSNTAATRTLVAAAAVKSAAVASSATPPRQKSADSGIESDSGGGRPDHGFDLPPRITSYSE